MTNKIKHFLGFVLYISLAVIIGIAIGLTIIKVSQGVN